MIAYVDSSVVLRIVLGQQGSFEEWTEISKGVASQLVETECLRTLDRVRIAQDASMEELAPRFEAVYRLLEEVEQVEVSGSILRRAGTPVGSPLGTLDAIHLATAELWRDSTGQDLAFATHDRALALAARASGFRVLGV